MGTFEPTRFLSANEVSLALRVPLWQIERLSRAGKVPHAVVGRIRAYAPSDLQVIRAAVEAADFRPTAVSPITAEGVPA